VKQLTLFIALWMLSCTQATAQQGFPNYYRLMTLSQQGDSLYTAGNFKEAARTYETAATIKLEKAIDYDVSIMYYNAACAYAKAGNVKAALSCLDLLICKHGYADVAQLEAEADFELLRKDTAWKKYMEAAKTNKKQLEARENTRKARTTLIEAAEGPVFYPLTAFATDLILQDSLTFLSFNHDIFRVYFAADGFAASRLNDLRVELDDALNRGRELLDVENFGRGIQVLLLNSVDEMEVISGMRVNGGVALIGHDLMLLPYHPGRRPQLRHELFHLLSHQAWGVTPSRLLNEGMAVYADNNCLVENPVYSINVHLMDSGRLLPLEALVHDFDQQARRNDVIAYLQSAGICKYLYETYGITKFRALWTAGFDDFEKIYGMTSAAFEQEWLAHIRRVIPGESVDIPRLLAEGCG